MLENNSDRMWWVIGTLLVGAALITTAKLVFPEMFDSVMEFFKTSLASVTKP